MQAGADRDRRGEREALESDREGGGAAAETAAEAEHPEDPGLGVVAAFRQQSRNVGFSAAVHDEQKLDDELGRLDPVEGSLDRRFDGTTTTLQAANLLHLMLSLNRMDGFSSF